MHIFKQIKDIFDFKRGHERSINIKKNILVSFGLKIISIAISFILVPLTLNYLDPTKYGIWITLSSIISWFSFFDIGLGNGLKNKFTEAIAKGDHEKAKIYVSTAYLSIGFISLLILLIYLIISPFLDWTKILNCNQKYYGELRSLALILVICFCFRFVMQLISVLLTAIQKPAISNLIDVLSSAFSLLGIFIVMQFTKGSLINICIIFGIVPLIVLLIANFYFFNNRLEFYKPNIKCFQFKYVKEILNLGIKFFLIQIACIVIFQTNNFIITQVLNPDAVTNYNIVYKLFSIFTMSSGIIMTPFWSAYTEAYTKKDIVWIQNMIKNFLYLMIPIILLNILFIIFSKDILRIWVGIKVIVDMRLIILMSLFTIISIWNNIWSNVLSGISKIRLGVYSTVFSAIINIPLSIYFAKNLNLGTSGVVLGTIVSIALSTIISPIQVYYFIFSKQSKKILTKILS